MGEIKEYGQALQERMRFQFERYLKSSEAQTIEYDPMSGRVGYERVVCGHAKNKKITFLVSATYHSDPSLRPAGDIGLKRRDFLEIIYLDKEKKETGSLQIIQANSGGTFITSQIQRRVSEDHIKFWNEGNIMRYLAIGESMRQSDIERVVELLESGEIDKKYTEKALNCLQTEFAHRRVKGK